MEEEKGRNIRGIFPAAILFTAEISHVIPVVCVCVCDNCNCIHVYIICSF